DSGMSSTDDVTNDNTPTFSVTGASPYFRFFRDGSPIGDYETGSSYTPPAQPEGTYTYAAAAVDSAGNSSPASSGIAVTIDTVAPANPAAPDLESASDSGVSAGDTLTSIKRPLIDFAAPERGVAHLSLNGGGGPSLQVPAGGTYPIGLQGPSGATL